MNTEEAVTLVQYNTWANHRVLLKAGRLSREQLNMQAGLSHHTALGTLLHILDTQWYWREGAQSGHLPVQTLAVADYADLASLRRRWELEDRLLLDFVGGLSTAQLQGPVTYSWPRARPRTRPLWHILVHIVNHGTHHRSEIGGYLKPWGNRREMWTLSSTFQKRHFFRADI